MPHHATKPSLLTAIQEQNPFAVNYWLQRPDPAMYNESFSGYGPALTLACRLGNLEIIALLLIAYQDDIRLPSTEHLVNIVCSLSESSRHIKTKQAKQMLLRDWLNMDATSRRDTLTQLYLLPHNSAASLFALGIFVSDGLLQTKTSISKDDKRSRFFQIFQRLPLELQMVLCRRAYGCLGGDVIRIRDSEPQFRELTKSLESTPSACPSTSLRKVQRGLSTYL